MALKDLLLRAFKTPPRADFEDNTNIGQPIGQSIQSYLSDFSTSNITVTPENAMSAPSVYACVKLISQTIARMPWMVLKNDYKTGTAEPDKEHSIFGLLNVESNEDMTAHSWRELTVSDLCLYGNSYSFIQRNAAGEAVSLEHLRPDYMYMARDAANQPYYQYYSGAVSDKASVENKQRMFRPFDILHSLTATGGDGILGMAPIAAMRNLIAQELALEEYVARFFSNSARPSGILTMPGTLSAEAAGRLRESWQKQQGGVFNSGRIAVLENGLTFSPVSTNMVENQMIDVRKYCRAQIASAFGVPSFKIGATESISYSSQEQGEAAFISSTLANYASIIEQEVNRKLFKRGTDYYTRINFDDLQRGDRASRYSSYNIGLTTGLLTVNEARALESLPSIGESGDTVRVPLNTATPGAVPDGKTPAAAGTVPPEQGSKTETQATPPPATTDSAPVIADTALNGAQIASILEIIASVSTGVMSAEAGKALILAGFPALDPAKIDTVLAGINQTPPAPTKAAPAPAAPIAPEAPVAEAKALELFLPSALAAMTRACKAEAAYLASCRTPAKVQRWRPDVARLGAECSPIYKGLLSLLGGVGDGDGAAIATAFADTIEREARARKDDWHTVGHIATAEALARRLISEIIQTNRKALNEN